MIAHRWTTLARGFPALAPLKTSDTDRVELVNQTIVEEVLQDLGVLDFGHGNTAETNIAIWRERGTHHPMCPLHRSTRDATCLFGCSGTAGYRNWRRSRRTQSGTAAADPCGSTAPGGNTSAFR